MNDHEIDRIAASINGLRPDWPTKSLRTLIATKLANRPRRDVAVALAWIACDPKTSTPARVLEAGPWWRAASIEGEVPNTPPKWHEACRICGKYADRCICDNGPTTRPPEPSKHTADHIDAARRALHGGNA